VAKKSHKLEILSPARREILEIAQLHKELVGPVSAKKITDKIKNSLNLLRKNPYMGMPLEYKDLRQLEYRKLICGNYLCFYRIIADTIYIYHIVDGRTNYPHIFKEIQTQ
jgi:plasmid stabilization system protein ParE